MRLNEITVKQLQKAISTLDNKTDPRIIQKIADLISLARGEDPSKTTTQYKGVTGALKKIPDDDIQKYYKHMAYMMSGNDLTADEIKKIVVGINTNKLIDIKQLKAVSSNLAKIIPMYNDSKQVRNYFKSMLMYQPGQRIGPGEILFATHHKDLTKPQKGDLRIISSQEDIEVKGGATEGRFRDNDLMPQGGTYENLAIKFLNKYKGKIQSVGSGSTMAHVVAGMEANPKIAKTIASDAAKVCQALFPKSPHVKKLQQALLQGDAQKALYYHGLGNLTQYFASKPKEGILFLRANTKPPQTNYANSLKELMKVATVQVSSAYPIAAKTQEAFPKIGAIPKS